jgi:hypothetical protein
MVGARARRRRLASLRRHLSSGGDEGAAGADVAAAIQLSEAEVQFYREQGFLALPGVVSADACAAMYEEVLDICELDPHIGLSRDELRDGGSREGDMLRQSAMHTREQLLYRLRNSPNLLRLASQVLEGRACLYNGFTAVKGARGGGMFELHQDNMYTRHDNGARTTARTAEGNSDGLGSCGIWVALHDLPTPESGTLLLGAGSHRRGTLDAVDYESARGRGADGSWRRGHDKALPEESPLRARGAMLPLRMRRGDVVLFSRATVHGSAPNTSEAVRVAYAMQYFREDVRWLDRSTGDEHSGVWRPLADGSSPFQQSLQPVPRLGAPPSPGESARFAAAARGTGGAGVQAGGAGVQAGGGGAPARRQE